MVATRIVVTRTGQLSTAQGLLSAAKDRKLQENLRSKDIEIGNLRLEADKVQRSIGAAQAYAAKATQKAAEANKAAEDERFARLKLEAQITPRRLTQQQELSIANACTQFRGHSVNVVSFLLDTEGAVLAKQIIAALRAAGMQAQDATASSSLRGSFLMGIRVTGQNAVLADDIRSILATDGHLAVSSTSAEPPSGREKRTGPNKKPVDVNVLVGVKPLQ